MKRPKNRYAKDLRTPDKYRLRVIPSKKDKSDTKYPKLKDLVDA